MVSFDPSCHIRLPIAKETGQSHTVKSADPDILEAGSKFLLSRKHYVIHATISLGVLRNLYLYSDTKCMYTLF